MAVISTTGQGQGAAQVVKQRPSQMGTIVSSFVDDYLAEQASKAKAQQEANAIEYEVSMAKDGLTGAYLGKANALDEDITSRVKRGEFSSKEGGRLLIDYVERLRGDQDKIFSDLKNASKVNSENYTHDEFGNVVDAPASEIGKLLLGEDAEKRGYENFDELNSKVKALYSRQSPRPKQDIPTIIKTKYIPLIKEKYNIKIDETLSPEQQDLILRSKISSLTQEAKDEITDMFLEDEDIRTNIYLKYSEAQMNTPEGAGFNDEFIDEKAKSFIEPFLGNRQVLESDIQSTGKKGGFKFTGGGSAENDLFSFSLSDKQEEKDKVYYKQGQKIDKSSFEVSITPKEAVSMGSKTSAKFTVGDEVISGTPTKIIGNGDDIKIQFISKLEYGNGEEIITVNYNDIETQMNDRYGLSRDVINKIVKGEEGEEDANRSDSAKKKEQGQTSKESSQPEIGTSSDLP